MKSLPSELTPDNVGDVSEMPALALIRLMPRLQQSADGAYDGEALYDAVAERHPEAVVIIPPRTTAVPTEFSNDDAARSTYCRD